MALDIRISPGSSVPIYRQIVDQVCRAVATGQLSPGDQLPSVRELAERLVINPNTVARAYADLVRETVVESRKGQRLSIVPRRQIYSDEERNRRLDVAMDAFIGEALFLAFTAADVRQAVERRLKQLDTPVPAGSESHE